VTRHARWCELQCPHGGSCRGSDHLGLPGTPVPRCTTRADWSAQNRVNYDMGVKDFSIQLSENEPGCIHAGHIGFRWTLLQAGHTSVKFMRFLV